MIATGTVFPSNYLVNSLQMRILLFMAIWQSTCIGLGNNPVKENNLKDIVLLFTPDIKIHI